MAKFNMKDSENFMKEEARQDRLQEALEDKCEKEAYDADANWYDWQDLERGEEYWQEQEDHICRKAVIRNRHHAAEKAKKKTEKSAKILFSKSSKAYNATDNSDLRLSLRAHSASKKYLRTIGKKNIVTNICKLVDEKNYSTFSTNMILVNSSLSDMPLCAGDYLSILDECEAYIKDKLINEMLTSLANKRFCNFSKKLSFAKSFLAQKGFPSFELDYTLLKLVEKKIM